MLHSSHVLGFQLSTLVALAVSAVGCLSAPASDGFEHGDHQGDALSGACAGLPTWTPGVSYATSSQVQYQGKAYTCLQAHTALSVWAPDIVPALWQETSNCGDGSSGSGSSSSGSSSSGGPGCGTGGGSGAGGGNGAGGSSGVGGSSSSSSGSGSSGSGDPGGGNSGTDYAPYFYTWGWGNPAYPFTGLADLHAKSGLGGVTLAFVLSSGGCGATQDVQQHQGDVDAFRAAGGKVKASFGGANGTYLENACGDAGSLAQAIGAFVDSTGIEDLDFDVEQGGAMGPDVNQRRAQALKMAQDQKGIQVAFTLAAFPRDKWGTPGGMTAASVDVVKAAVAAGVQISHVNLMTMDYGGYYSSGKAMGDLAISALTDANDQLRAIIPGLSEAGAYAMLGATPMIGQNDVQGETFTLADAQSLTNFAKQKQLGLVSFWAINRDQPGSGSLGLYSGVNTGTFDFHAIFKTVQ